MKFTLSKYLTKEEYQTLHLLRKRIKKCKSTKELSAMQTSYQLLQKLAFARYEHEKRQTQYQQPPLGKLVQDSDDYPNSLRQFFIKHQTYHKLKNQLMSAQTNEEAKRYYEMAKIYIAEQLLSKDITFIERMTEQVNNHVIEGIAKRSDQYTEITGDKSDEQAREKIHDLKDGNESIDK
ncbi:hypothetical protein [Salirhabdus salicampi]|uniref:hypothetical protein n=1 Tax=Salirhabdus salicampi TaxID=476102 RepID=UPI0020C587CC|nr:hypothetical protein [Salirhabdus salicampi]MCP8616038.1 hypothetical protein [Salirhabdus salicampi]